MKNVCYFSPFTSTTTTAADSGWAASVPEQGETKRAKLVYMVNHPGGAESAPANWKAFSE